jgi:lipopolysaccharide export system protein LptA
MDLRVYSADARMALEMTMESPEATLLAKKNRAVSDSSLEIRGANFELSGRGWRWDGDTKVIEVDHEAEVRFTGEDGEAGVRTVVTSDRLRLQTTPEDYRFIFSGGVRVERGATTIEGGALLAFAEAPEGESAPAAAQGRIESIRRILVREEVILARDGWTAYAGEVEFFPAEDRAELRQLPRIEAPGAYIAGAAMTLAPGRAKVEGGGEAGRAQAILTRAGQLGLGGAAALDSETVVLADSIVMTSGKGRGSRFLFDGSVELMSGPLQVSAGRLEVESERSAPEEEGVDSGSFTARRVTATEEVVIERDGYRATGGEAVFHPLEERAVLSGGPRVTGESLKVEAARLHLLPDGALAESGEGEASVRVALPALPDLGYDLSALPGGDGKGESGTGRDARGTTVRSRTARVYDEESGRRFVFSDEVAVEGTNLEAACDEMTVWAEDGGEESVARIDRIEASGGVTVVQEGRTASAGRALILPAEGKLVLEDGAVVEDKRGRASGSRLTVLRGERRAIVEGDAEAGERARITLPGLGGNP